MELSYQDLRKRLEALIRKAELSTVFDLLKEHESLLSAELNSELILLEVRFSQLQKDKLQQQINSDDYNIGLNNITKGLLYMLDQEHNSPISSSGKRREGLILHDIPRKMPLDVITKVVVRLADDEFDLLEDFHRTVDTKIEAVRISEVMEVHLGSENSDAFAIRSSSEDQQFLENGEYTEWIFKVRPLMLGAHILELKVVVLELINGKERRRSVVLERSVQVLSEFVDLPQASFNRLVWATSIELGDGILAKRVKGDPTRAGSISHLAYQDILETLEAKKKASQQQRLASSPSLSKKSKRGRAGAGKKISSEGIVKPKQTFLLKWVLIAILLISLIAILIFART